MKSLIILASIVSSAMAAPAAAATAFDATFDNRPGSAVDPELFPVNIYRGLSWPTFNVDADTLSAVKARSGHQQAASTVVASGVTNPSITADYPNSKTKSFDLYSTYLGCVVGSQTGFLPEPCTLSFTGVKKGGVKTSSETCEYKGTVANPASVLCTFMKLSGVETVEIVVENSTMLGVDTVVLLDEVKEKTHS